jgi:K+-transporting ATPase ATPase C chain
MFREQIKPAILMFLVLTIITGIIYPLFVTGLAQIFFQEKANGSLIYQNGKPVGATLIGQQFNDPKYFWGRPSATSGVAYNAATSSGSNLGPLSPVLNEAVQRRIEALNTPDPENTTAVPIDLITSSASGLDPHISLAAAYYQVPRVALVRNLSEDAVKEIILQHTKERLLGVVGEPVVNVLEVNLALDKYKQ